ncbi:MAG: hypothetical protein OXR68_00050 [Alphaproteobacteria bacterium]|nr:hypothetical protein [Alphaproteobacteria bacterium]MDD9919002.1 hypothetical protein [Alphaproteobacteria bacterium]
MRQEKLDKLNIELGLYKKLRPMISRLFQLVEYTIISGLVSYVAAVTNNNLMIVASYVVAGALILHLIMEIRQVQIKGAEMLFPAESTILSILRGLVMLVLVFFGIYLAVGATMGISAALKVGIGI